IDYPDFVRELQIVKTKIPTIDSQLAVQITHFMQEVRQLRLEKTPGVAETLDWAAALAALHFDHLDEEIVSATLGIIIKDWQDIRKTQLSLSELLERVGAKTKLEEL
ncbi:MAG: MoxR family ATPase, partial [Saprospiraceae bacterium]|nr:MoxR family ATPase [Saprospiraceae bacterium]